MWNEKLFLDQMEENTHFSLLYPYHIYFEKLSGENYYNESYPDSFHEHRFIDILNTVFKEPNAFYLTEADKEYYSRQELDFIERIKSCEIEKINRGYCLVNMNLDDDVVEGIREYCVINNMTIEESIVDILKKSIAMFKEIKGKNEED